MTEQHKIAHTTALARLASLTVMALTAIAAAMTAIAVLTGWLSSAAPAMRPEPRPRPAIDPMQITLRAGTLPVVQVDEPF